MSFCKLVLFFCLVTEHVSFAASHANAACRNKYIVNRMYCIDNRSGEARKVCLKEEKNNYKTCVKKKAQGGIEGQNYLVYTKGLSRIYKKLNQKNIKKCRPVSQETRVIVTLDEQTKFVQMNVGQELELILGENPSTGFKWVVVDENTSCVRLIKESYRTVGGSDSNSQLAETIGQMVFLFKATEVCSVPAKIFLSYQRAVQTGSNTSEYTKEVTVDVQDNSADVIVDMRKKTAPLAQIQVDQVVKIILPASPTTGYIWHVDTQKAPCLNTIRQQYEEEDTDDSDLLVARKGRMNYWFQAKYLCADQFIGLAYEPEWSFDGFTNQNTREIRIKLITDESKIVMFDIDSVEGRGPFYVEMVYGSTLHVKANADPLSGYSWLLLPSNPAKSELASGRTDNCLKLLRRSFVADDETVGSGGGKEHFVFRANRPCQKELNLAYMGQGAFGADAEIQKRRQIRLTVVKRARTERERCKDLAACQMRLRSSFGACAMNFEKVAQEVHTTDVESTGSNSTGGCFQGSMKNYKSCVRSLNETVAPSIKLEQVRAEDVSRESKPIPQPSANLKVVIKETKTVDIKKSLSIKTETEDPFELDVEKALDVDKPFDEEDFENW